ncbi:MAG TPA: homocysteine S-methyltransferase family protein [Caproicibacter sp.]|nr:homocysteine S-methyltransferase family protein [Caproicibacter sp.]
MEFPFELPFLFDAASETCPAGRISAERIDGCVKAGAGAVCAPTFEASRAFLPDAAENEIDERNTRLVQSVRDAAGNVPVGGVLGPTGFLVPPLGESDFEDIYAAYREQVSALDEVGADFLLLNRQTSLADMRAALLAARSTNLPVFACLALDENGMTKAGTQFLPALITLQAMGADAVGICGVPDEKMLSEIHGAVPHASVPLIVIADSKPGQTPEEYAETVQPLLDAGVRIVGCGQNTTAEHLKQLKDNMKKYGSPEIPEEPDCYAAAIEREAFFLGDDIIFSKPIRCSSSLSDDLIDLDDEQVSAALVDITSIDDAALLGQSSSMTKLSAAVRADSPTVLEAALRYFQGRLIIDSGSPIEREVLEPLAAKYGAIIY